MINGELQINRGVLSKNYYYIRVEDLVKVFRKESNEELSPNGIETKIAVYEDRVNGWFFDAVDVLEEAGATFAILQLAIPYVERSQHLMDGMNKQDAFSRAVRRIFALDKSYNEVVRRFRNHLVTGTFTDLVVSNSLKAAIEKGDYAHKINVNPGKFMEGVRKDMKNQIAQLKDKKNRQLRKNFDKMFRLI